MSKSRKQLKREKKSALNLLNSYVRASRKDSQRIAELEAELEALRKYSNELYLAKEKYRAEPDKLRGELSRAVASGDMWEAGCKENYEKVQDLEHELLVATITVEKIRDALLDVRSEIASGFNNAAEQLATSGEASLKAIDEIVETETQWISPPWAETSDNPNLGPESFRTSWDEKE